MSRVNALRDELATLRAELAELREVVEGFHSAHPWRDWTPGLAGRLAAIEAMLNVNGCPTLTPPTRQVWRYKP